MGMQEVFNALKKHHKGALVDLNKECSVEGWSTGHFLIDRVLGQGFPKGRIVELWGPEGSGKSTIALQTGKSVQKANMGVLYVDYEHAFDKSYAEQLGLNMDYLIVAQPDYGEQGFDIMKDAIDLGGVGLIIIDSVAAITPRKEIEGEEAIMGEHGIGRQSMIVTQCLKQLCARVSKANVCVLAINQIRSTVTSYGSSETTPGGKALKFYASIRLKMIKTQGIKKETSDGLVTSSLVGQKVKFITVKNKICSPFREAQVELYFGRGFDESASLVEMAIGKGIVKKSGAYFEYKGENHRGFEAIRQVILADADIKGELIANAGAVKSSELSDTEGSGTEAG